MKPLTQYNFASLEEQLLCFIHIPKTAGSSFTKALIDLVGQNRFRILFPDILVGQKDADLDINTYNGISGHFPYEIHKLISRPTLFLTFLRSPLSRSISHFKQFKRMNLDNPLIKKSEHYRYYDQVRHMTFEEFIEHPFWQDEISNLQTRMLGLLIDHPIHQLKELNPINNANDRLYSLELAKERLEQFAFLGLQERFSESMSLFSFVFGAYPNTNLPNLNVSPNQDDFNLSEQAKEKIESLNNMDVKLYEFGQKLFAKRYDKMILDLQQNYQVIDGSSLFEALSNMFFKTHQIKTFPFRYEFDEVYPRSGWYPIERVDEAMWVWSGPQIESTIDLPLERKSNLQVHFQIRNFIELDILESIELYIDGRRIQLTHTIDNKIHSFVGTIPADSQKDNIFTHFSLHVDKTVYPPGMTASTPGARLLGFALSWIEITPLE